MSRPDPLLTGAEKALSACVGELVSIAKRSVPADEVPGVVAASLVIQGCVVWSLVVEQAGRPPTAQEFAAFAGAIAQATLKDQSSQTRKDY